MISIRFTFVIPVALLSLQATITEATVPYDIVVYEIKVNKPQDVYKEGQSKVIFCSWYVQKAAIDSSWDTLSWAKMVKLDGQVVMSEPAPVSDAMGPKKFMMTYGWDWKPKGGGKHTITCEVSLPNWTDIHPGNNSKSLEVFVEAVDKADTSAPVVFGGQVPEIKQSTENKSSTTQTAKAGDNAGPMTAGDVKLALPDLTLEHMNAQPSPGCSDKHAIRIDLSVRNAGNKASPPLAGNHGLYVDALDDAIVDKRVNLPALQPKQNSTQQIILVSKVQPSELAGKTVYMDVMVNKEKRVGESDYANNMRKVRVVFPTDHCKMTILPVFPAPSPQERGLAAPQANPGPPQTNPGPPTARTNNTSTQINPGPPNIQANPGPPNSRTTNSPVQISPGPPNEPVAR